MKIALPQLDVRSAEFAPNAAQWTDEKSRRDFLKLMAASIAIAGAHGCTDKSDESIVPYVNQPEGVVPGRATQFATAMPFNGFGRGVLVTSREGRPIKIEGNPDHPASLGGTDAFMQASILTLYDPNRSQSVTRGGNPTSWSAFTEELSPRLQQLRKSRGEGLRILSAPVISPTLAAQMREFKQQFPQARWHQYSPLARNNIAAGTQLAFGRRLNVVYRFDQASTIVSLDSDFLTDEPGSVRYARQFMDRRRVRMDHMEMNRLYVIESSMSITGSMADHRLALRPSEIANVADTLLKSESKWLRAAADDLRQAAGRSIVIAGESQAPSVHAAAYAINQQLGNIGKTIVFTDPIEAEPVDTNASLRELVADMTAGHVNTLLILGENPAHSTPADISFADALQRMSSSTENLTAHLGLYEDQTSFRCQWHLPEAHYLEMWSDARAFDGTASIIQPLIAPLYHGRSSHELVELLLGRADRSGLEIVRGTWAARNIDWQVSLRRGIIDGTAAPVVQVASVNVPTHTPPKGSQLELVIRPDPTIWDGSFFHNAWLQEAPKPFTKLVWDNAAVMSPKTARTLGVVDRDVITIELRERKVDAPVMTLPGCAENTVTIHLGYGLDSRGFDAYQLRFSDAMWSATDIRITRAARRYDLVTTHNHHAMIAGDEAAERGLIRDASLEKFRTNPQIIKEGEHPPSFSMYPRWDFSKGYQWGMSIDTTACIGCNACLVACQAENNIPVVGKREVERQREMHWIRVDDYFDGPEDDPHIVHQPVPCMHCENAPCEYVCPTGATTHSAEGINQMTYNRCVGTRYCNNNCPYKVRRFNFLSYAEAETTPQRKLQRNPEVTVRTNGVMEKCTYCIQRIQRTRIDIENELVRIQESGDPSRAAEVEFRMLESLETACSQACPTRAIVFGDINKPNTRVAQAKAQPHDYSLLEDLNTHPRTTYLARIRNPNPALESARTHE